MGSIALLLAFVAMNAFPTDVNPIQSSVILRGTVVDFYNGQPLAGAYVYASSVSDVQKSVTDAEGRFTFINLRPGSYLVSATKPGVSDCSLPNPKQELNAGFEYVATVLLFRSCS